MSQISAEKLSMNLSFVQIFIILALSVSLSGCGFDASITGILNQDSNDVEDGTDETADPVVSNPSPFTVKYNGKLTYTNSMSPQIEITGVNDITHYLTASSKSACEASVDWKVYDSESRIEVLHSNQAQTYFLKVKKTNDEIVGCYEISMTHDNVPPDLSAGVNLLAHTGMSALDRSPQISHAVPTDNVAGVDKVEIKMINFEDKSNLTDWILFNNPGTDLNLPSPLAIGTMFQVLVRVYDKAGNFKEFVNQEAFIGSLKVDLLSEPDLCSVGQGVAQHIDFDLDGDYDAVQIASGNFFEGMCFFENHGNKFLSYKAMPAFSKTLWHGTVVDLDQDGIEDIVGDNFAGDLIVFYGKGNADFEVVTLKAGPGNVFKNVVNLNADAKMDILFASGSTQIWLEQTAPRQFTENILTTPIGLGIAKFVQLDSDGKIDLYTGVSAGKLQFLKNSGDNLQFSLVEVTVAINSATAALPMDYNGDGYIDIFHSRSSSTAHTLSINDGTGQFNSSLINLDIGGSTIRHVVDLNQDGYDDFIASGNYLVFTNNAGSGFSQTAKLERFYADEDYRISFRDLNNDQKTDILYSAQYALNDNGLRLMNIFMNSGTNGFEVQRSNLLQTDWTTDIIAEDLNNDGVKEILIQDVHSDSVFIYEKKNNVFVPSQYMHVGNLQLKLLVTDRNSDGLKDIISVHNGGSTNINFIEQNSNMNFTDTVITQAYTETDVVSAQLTAGDAFLDLVVGTNSTHQLILYKNTTGASAYSKQFIENSASYYPISIAVYDYDGDTYNDIIVTGSDLNVYLYKNDAANNFVKSTLLTNAYTLSDLRTMDLDSNGLVDLVMAERVSINTRKLVAYYQTSVGVFNRVEIVTMTYYSGNNIHPFDLCDYDSDGDTDIIAQSTNDLNIYANITGVFGSAQLITKLNADVQKIRCTNLDSDSAKEILVLDTDKVLILNH